MLHFSPEAYHYAFQPCTQLWHNLFPKIFAFRSRLLHAVENYQQKVPRSGFQHTGAHPSASAFRLAQNPFCLLFLFLIFAAEPKSKYSSGIFHCKSQSLSGHLMKVLIRLQLTVDTAHKNIFCRKNRRFRSVFLQLFLNMLNSGSQLFLSDRLLQKSVCAQFNGLSCLLKILPLRKYDHPYIDLPVTQLPQHCKPITPGHLCLCDDKLRPHCADHLIPRCSVTCRSHDLTFRIYSL